MFLSKKGRGGVHHPQLLQARIGCHLRRLRLERGLTQRELAEKADISLEYTGRLERGQVTCSLETLADLALALHTDPLELVAPAGEDRQEDQVRFLSVLARSLCDEHLQLLIQVARTLQPSEKIHGAGVLTGVPGGGELGV